MEGGLDIGKKCCEISGQRFGAAYHDVIGPHLRVSRCCEPYRLLQTPPRPVAIDSMTTLFSRSALLRHGFPRYGEAKARLIAY